MDLTLLVGIFFCFIGREHHKNISLVDQIVFIILSFILVPLLISVPYYLSIYNISFLNSYFESVSGITTTGFSIIKNVQDLNSLEKLRKIFLKIIKKNISKTSEQSSDEILIVSLSIY